MAGSLAKYYGWTYQTIADMTMDQCVAAMEAAVKESDANAVDEGKPGLDGKMHFSTREQWEFWKETRGLNG